MHVSAIHFSRISRAFLALAALALVVPSPAAAFCGFYVAGADTKLYANATMVVLMRDGTRTVLSMQNNYQGPPEAFALVIPVPTVLTQDQVKILPKAVFQHVDALGAPRLVEYWEDDPCHPQFLDRGAVLAPTASSNAGAGSVKVEAQFAVGEYDVVILSANDASALDSWLRTNNYNIPSGASAVLKPYVDMGTKFFVAKVDPSRVTFVNGQAALSPLRFHYDTPDFALPVRLGLLNSQGAQDLIVNILAPSRYEVANYPNVTIPTNLRVENDVRNMFPSFYEALFSKLVEKNPGAVVTEYAWDSGSCDPCPTPPLDQSDLATLGADVTQSLGSAGAPTYVNYTLTRLHYRYTKDNLGEDLVFKKADALVGGRGIPDAKGNLDTTVQPANGTFNNFQGRYVILHPWDTAVSCQSPQPGQWGGQNGGSAPPAQGTTNAALSGAPPSAADLSKLLSQSLPALDVSVGAPAKAPPPAAGTNAASAGTAAASAGTGTTQVPVLTGAGTGSVASAGTGALPKSPVKTPSGCGSCSVGAQQPPPWAALGAGLMTFTLLGIRHRRRSNRARAC
jgi:hypothetical protein